MRSATRNASRLRQILLLALGSFFLNAQAAPPLPALNIDIKETSISGISSGGFMSVQFQVAHSSIVKGAGIVAGGPFYCSQNKVTVAVSKCSCTATPAVACEVTDTSADVPKLVETTRKMYEAPSPAIDNPDYLAGQKIVMISGAKDSLVPPPIARQLADYYAALGVPAKNVSPVKLDNAGHTMPTPDYGAACDKEEEPYIGKCGFDSAKAILGWIYDDKPLQPPGAKPAGKFIQFDQKAYIPSDQQSTYLWTSGLDSTGWIYVPNSCAKGEPCRLHIALHGCKQGQGYMPLKPLPGGDLYYGTRFVKHTGYDRWADKNHLVILYPQAVSIPYMNPNGCWDWWGYTGGDYATRDSVQIRTLKAMADQLSSGYKPQLAAKGNASRPQ